ncbi:MAG TPA: NAD(P)/FAD-dependent oxidoreductase, partial [Dehalococcoidia bacterium]|nr:NAD(P)/FAD-dependent oxidoreductase [Dehalococcoidia bacterium]
TAMLLARKGYRVLVVDKATFPSDAIGNNLVKPPAMARLKRWGLMERVVALGCPPVSRVTYDFDDCRLLATVPPIDGVAAGYGPRRHALDALLVDAAREAGAEVREGFSVEEITMDGERVTGIRGRAGGETVCEQARLVIGADGRNSLVARAVAAPEYNVHPPLACYYYSYFSGVPIEGIEVAFRDYRVLLALGTLDGLTCVIAGWPQGEFSRVRAAYEREFWQALALYPALAERVRAGRREERFTGVANLRNFFRKPYGPGWALVGDAGYHKDPILAQGSSDAFRDVELLVEAIDAGFCGRQPPSAGSEGGTPQTIDQALADYEARRNTESLPMYELNRQRATLAPATPEMRRLRRALACNQEAANQFAGVSFGTVPVQQFFAPENLQRLLAGVN